MSPRHVYKQKVYNLRNSEINDTCHQRNWGTAVEGKHMKNPLSYTLLQYDVEKYFGKKGLKNQ